MSNIAIEFNHIGKQYALGTIGTGTLSRDVNRWWARMRGKEDPYLKIGEVNDRTQKSESGFVWALRDIDFKVEQGEVVGIIGKNGAGKSTLLKILSRVTSPTVGSIRARGRIASLLEVGTGFHPEMTGRENIYMNGSIMGMTRAEITRKLDEIVAFAGVEKYLDTPVKRYSSGMMVRLGFAIAAHLEPEILVVDEVLAVGDAEFQKKAIGKMQDVSKGEGRTVLFVSHNMAAVKALCKKGIVLKDGMLDYTGNIIDSLEHYQRTGNSSDIKGKKILDCASFCKPSIRIDSIYVNGQDDIRTTISSLQHTLDVEFNGYTSEGLTTDLMVVFKNKDGLPLATYALGHYKGELSHFPVGSFKLKQTIQLPQFLSNGTIIVDLSLHHPMVEWQFRAMDCCVLECEGYQEGCGRVLNQITNGLFGLNGIAHEKKENSI